MQVTFELLVVEYGSQGSGDLPFTGEVKRRAAGTCQFSLGGPPRVGEEMAFVQPGVSGAAPKRRIQSITHRIVAGSDPGSGYWIEAGLTQVACITPNDFDRAVKQWRAVGFDLIETEVPND